MAGTLIIAYTNNWMVTAILQIENNKGSNMAIGVIATITIQADKTTEFERVFADLAEKVRSNEPGNVFYALHRSQQEPTVYKVLEQYESAADLDAHGKTDYFADANKVLATMVAAAPHIEILDAV